MTWMKPSLTLAFLTLAGIFILAIPRPVAAQKAPQEPPTINVNVVNPPTSPVPVSGTVNVGNLGSSPLPVREIDKPALQSVHKNDGCTTDTTFCEKEIFIVPLDKHLVIEFVSNRGIVPLGTTVSMEVRITEGSITTVHALPFVPSVNFELPAPAHGEVYLGQSLRLYAKPGATVRLAAYRNGVASTNPYSGYVFSISGYLVNAP